MNPKAFRSAKLMILAATLVIIGTAPSFAQKELKKSYQGIKKIRMNASSGSCRIKKSTDNSTLIEVRYTFDEGQFEPSISQEGDRVVIKERFHGNSSGDSNWTLTVPDNTDIQLTTGSGDVESSDISLQLEATTGSGNLTFTNIGGDVHGTTGSGNVELSNSKGDININTGSGSMRIDHCRGEIQLNCGSGNIKIADSQASFRANTGSGNITSKNLTLDGSSTFNTGSGDAVVVLAATPQFDLGVNTGSGNAELNFNGNAIVGEIVMRANKRNGRITAPFEFDKTEELNEGGRDQVTVQKTAVKGNAAHRVSVSTGSGEAILKN